METCRISDAFAKLHPFILVDWFFKILLQILHCHSKLGPKWWMYRHLSSFVKPSVRRNMNMRGCYTGSMLTMLVLIFFRKKRFLTGWQKTTLPFRSRNFYPSIKRKILNKSKAWLLKFSKNWKRPSRKILWWISTEVFLIDVLEETPFQISKGNLVDKCRWRQ